MSKGLIIDKLTLTYRRVPIIENYSLNVEPGAIHQITGASGSGKTLLANTILGFTPPSIVIESGSIMYNGIELTTLSLQQRRILRSKEFGLISQHPQTALNPTMKIKYQLLESIDNDCVEEKLDEVSLSSSVLEKYPHQLSGGMCQRIQILMALYGSPSLLIADEPTTALDEVNHQKCLNYILKNQKEKGFILLLISHKNLQDNVI